jgi:ribosomal protein S18 acetylase RimI-like enzyme
MNQPVVASAADHDDVVAVLATAFEQDPVLAALLPDAGSRPTRLRRFFAIDAGPWALNHSSSWILRDGVEPLGAAVVIPSARRHNPAQNHPATMAGYLRAFGRHSLKARGFLEVLERAHPVEEHMYLPFIGAAVPGRGVGSRLLSALGRAADERGLPVYLEASTEESARLYRRHGFADTGTIVAPDMPPMYAMWREPSTT